MPFVTVVNRSRGNFTLSNPFGSLRAGESKTASLTEKQLNSMHAQLANLHKGGFISYEVAGEKLEVKPVLEAKPEPVMEMKPEPVTEVEPEPIVEVSPAPEVDPVVVVTELAVEEPATPAEPSVPPVESISENKSSRRRK